MPKNEPNKCGMVSCTYGKAVPFLQRCDYLETSRQKSILILLVSSTVYVPWKDIIDATSEFLLKRVIPVITPATADKVKFCGSIKFKSLGKRNILKVTTMTILEGSLGFTCDRS